MRLEHAAKKTKQRDEKVVFVRFEPLLSLCSALPTRPHVRQGMFHVQGFHCTRAHVLNLVNILLTALAGIYVFSYFNPVLESNSLWF